jgi:DNA-binding response OmpR family regulator
MPNPALLLTNEEQAVQVIGQVLAEFGFAVERPANTPAAVKEIETRSLGIVLIDCDDVVSGKLLLDTCRRSKGNQGVPAVVIVSGRTGLPTAFRLGAEFVVSKPASLDQVRQTIRKAVSRTGRKEAPSASPAPNQTPLLAKGAAAGANSNLESTPLQAVSSLSPASVQPAKAEVAPELVSTASAASAAATAPEKAIVPPAPAKTAKRASAPNSAPKIQDDPVLADLDDLENPGAFSQPAYTELKLKKRKPVLAFVIVMILLAVAGGYAGFMLRPDFRDIVLHAYAQARILIGKPLPQPTPPPAAAPAKVQVAPKATPSPESANPDPASAPVPEDAAMVPEATRTPGTATASPSAPAPPTQTHAVPTSANPQH